MVSLLLGGKEGLRSRWQRAAFSPETKYTWEARRGESEEGPGLVRRLDGGSQNLTFDNRPTN